MGPTGASAPADNPAPISRAWVRALLRWYKTNRRAMPWRSHPRPYAVWVSEIMLQQTQVATVIPYFRRFMRLFPSIRALAAADEQAVLKAWEGLGYYSRARNLRRGAQLVVADYGGRLPRSAAALRALPGIGPYTSAAIASICFGEREPVVDGNVLRFYTRFAADHADVSRQSTRHSVRDRLADVMPADQPGDFNQALMEIGALVCRPVAPRCRACPVRRWCEARRQDIADRLPVRAPRRPVPHILVAVGVVRRRGRILVARRRPDQMLGGLWEFPGGRQLDDEPMEETVRRELREETTLEVNILHKLCVVTHAYSHFKITIHAYVCAAPRGRARTRSRAELKWVPTDALEQYPFPAANRQILARILDESSGAIRRA